MGSLDTVGAIAASWWFIALVAAASLDILRRARRRKRPFRGKHVLVTGGSAGIGKAFAAELLARGARVTLLARTESKLVEAVAELAAGAAKGGAKEPQVQHVVASIADEAALSAAVARAASKFGPVDVLVANAGTAAPGLFLEMPTSIFQQQMDLNYMGTLKSIKAVLPGMVERRAGHVIIVSSAVACVGFLGYSSYAPTKHALRGLADSLRNEVLSENLPNPSASPPPCPPARQPHCAAAPMHARGVAAAARLRRRGPDRVPARHRDARLRARERDQAAGVPRDGAHRIAWHSMA